MFVYLRNVLSERFKKKDFWFFWGLGLILLIIFHLTVTIKFNSMLTDLMEKDQKLSKEISILESQVIKSKDVKEKLYQLIGIVETYKAFLPKSEDVNNVAILLGSSARNSGLELEKLTFRREKEKISAFNIKLSGNFLSIMDFLNKVLVSPFLIGVKGFNLSVAQDSLTLKMDIDFLVLER
ncbi:MAG: type 4a pilus biogenesis protein PilO [Synergistetes bacterium]|nr:type 4a pilus biogenesis protein PilO [Synergistota bacterium]